MVDKKNMETNEDKIIILFEEYKELLIIKRKYEELKSQQTTPWVTNPRGTTITYYKDEKNQESNYSI